MEFNDVINNVLYTVLTAIVPVITVYLVNLIRAKIQESNVLKESISNETFRNIVNGALNDVMDAVLYVNQVYTDSLKSAGKFDKEAQKEAFNKAYTEATNMISDEAKRIIEQLYGSFDQWLKLKIESSVNTAKKQ